jgi:hypothetical protein
MRKNNLDVSKPAITRLRCAIYTRKSTEEGLDQEFNSLDAQREAGEAFVQSQRREGWIALPELYDDGGFTGANMDRPALTRLLRAVEAGELDCFSSAWHPSNQPSDTRSAFSWEAKVGLGMRVDVRVGPFVWVPRRKF